MIIKGPLVFRDHVPYPFLFRPFCDASVGTDLPAPDLWGCVCPCLCHEVVCVCAVCPEFPGIPMSHML